MAFSIDLAPVAVANGAGTFYGCRPCLFGVTSSWAGRLRSELRRSRSNSRRQPELRGDLNSPADAPLCSPRLACIRGDAPLNVNVSGHTLTFCVSSTGGAIDEGLRSNPAPRYVLRHHFNAKIPPHGLMPANLRFQGTRREASSCFVSVAPAGPSTAAR